MGSRFGIGIFPLAVVGMVIIMILPLPAFALDCLLMLNIALAILLLLAVVYTTEPEKLTTLPSVLLLATLFRLGINVSTTRQLLAEGQAPDTISAFGTFVVHGNLVVGGVLFAIITLVQFLVIAKGAERVAEVAARFALDALPGKQMSIDADLRSGILSMTEAKSRREALQRESKLYGSLDGAMKFVKGDAIAGLCITVVNVLGGLFVGVYQHGMEVSEALSRFTLFTIGDGLSSQIPALLVAVAAGVAVTRVHGDDDRKLGDDVVSQLMQEPHVLISTGVVVFGIGCIPGLPGLVFWTMGAVLLLLGVRQEEQQRATENQSSQTVFRPKSVPGLVLHLSTRATEALQKQGSLPAKAQRLRNQLFESLGLFVYDIQFEIRGEWNECQAAIVHQGEVIVEYLGEQDSDGPGDPGRALEDWILVEVERFVLQASAELVDDTQIRLLFELHRATTEDIVNSLVPAKISVTEVTEVVRALVEEGVGVRQFARILQALAEVEYLDCGHVLSTASNPGAAQGQVFQRRLSHVRKQLRRQISKSLVSAAPLHGLLVDSELSTMLQQHQEMGATPDPSVMANIRAAISSHQGAEIILICAGTVRRGLAMLLVESDVRAVLSAEELEPDLRVEMLGTIGVDGEIRPAVHSEIMESGEVVDDTITQSAAL